jgi:hypothetical protein
VQAAPAGLAFSSVAAAKGVGATATTLAIAKGTSQMMTLAKIKMAVGASLAAMAGAAIIVAAEKGAAGGGQISAPLKTQSVEVSSNAATLRANPASYAATPSSEADQNLSPTNLIAKLRMAYAALSTYRDSGWTVHEYGTNVWTNRSKVLMGGRNLYRIEMINDQRTHAYTNRYWSDGLDNQYQHMTALVFTRMDLAANLSATISDTAAPALFFNLPGSPLLALMLGPESELARHPDERVGDADCYVLERKNAVGATNASRQVMIWIGKGDFLVHRWRDQTVPHNASGKRMVQTETHENIVVNEDLKRQDYAPNW